MYSTRVLKRKKQTHYFSVSNMTKYSGSLKYSVVKILLSVSRAEIFKLCFPEIKGSGDFFYRISWDRR